MGTRLNRIVTRAGDDGTTRLADGTHLRKDDPRIEVIGCVDELNSAIGMVAAQGGGDEIAPALRQIQHSLFELGAELAQPGARRMGPRFVEGLETQLEAWNRQLPPLREFVLPGGSPAAAACHLARAICRRAERRLVRLAGLEPVNPESLRYLNRLADLLFVAARVLARKEGAEVLWEPDSPPRTEAP